MYIQDSSITRKHVRNTKEKARVAISSKNAETHDLQKDWEIIKGNKTNSVRELSDRETHVEKQDLSLEANLFVRLATITIQNELQNVQLLRHQKESWNQQRSQPQIQSSEQPGSYDRNYLRRQKIARNPYVIGTF